MHLLVTFAGRSESVSAQKRALRLRRGVQRKCLLSRIYLCCYQYIGTAPRSGICRILIDRHPVISSLPGRPRSATKQQCEPNAAARRFRHFTPVTTKVFMQRAESRHLGREIYSRSIRSTACSNYPRDRLVWE